MGVPLLFGTRKRLERSGERFRGECPKCGTVGSFYGARETFNVNMFLAISLWDSAEEVVQCGECLATFEPGEIAALPEEAKATLTERVTRALGGGGGEKGAAAGARERETEAVRAEKKLGRDVDAEIDAELAAMKRRLGK